MKFAAHMVVAVALLFLATRIDAFDSLNDASKMSDADKSISNIIKSQSPGLKLLVKDVMAYNLKMEYRVLNGKRVSMSTYKKKIKSFAKRAERLSYETEGAVVRTADDRLHNASRQVGDCQGCRKACRTSEITCGIGCSVSGSFAIVCAIGWAAAALECENICDNVCQ